jgi:polysaccharide deacetylase family protein (PEP-CTERM system associated)
VESPERGVPYLFSIDLEDIRLMFPGGTRFRPRVPAMAERYLEYLRRHSARATFFVVGDVARAHPSLIREIVAEGHEVACHTDTHLHLDRQLPAGLRDDLRRNLEALAAAGAEDVRGFRAPAFSLVERTAWAYDVLAELGFRYSSSVLPAAHPLYGWPGFGTAPRMCGSVVELPLTLLPSGPMRVPFGGGIYFRVLPWPWLARAFRNSLRRGEPVLGYLHPFDVDGEQESFMHPGIGGSRLYNALMLHNRGGVLRRLDRVREMGFRFVPYREYVEELSRRGAFAA